MSIPLNEEVQAAATWIGKLRNEIGKVIVGQGQLVDRLLVGLLASVSLGVVGSYVVTRRITYIAAAISHCVLGGIGAAYYFNVARGLTWCNPLYGALAAALLSAVIIGMVSLYAKQR